jgi:hypothetical protein
VEVLTHVIPTSVIECHAPLLLAILTNQGGNMPDPKTRFEPLDPGRIDTQSEEEMSYWCRELHCTHARLLQAVKRVGNHVAAVRDYLHQHPGAGSHPAAGGNGAGSRSRGS